MEVVAIALVALPPVLLVYAYIGYPWILRVLAARRPVEVRSVEDSDPASGWPGVSVSLPS